MEQSFSEAPDRPMVRLQIYGLLRLMLGGRESMELTCNEGETVRQILDRFQSATPIPVTRKLIDAGGSPHIGTIILLNRKNILHMSGLETVIHPGDVLALFPPGAGG